MTTTVLSGRVAAEAVYDCLRPRIIELAARGVVPGLAAVLVGDNPASHLYVRNKTRTFEKLGLLSETIVVPDSSSTEQLLDLVAKLNEDRKYHGILIQLPLPGQIDEAVVVRKVSPEKDVDGFHPENLGLLVEGRPRFVPCTPKGIVVLLKHYGIATAGRHVVVVGRSAIVGRPLSILLSLKREEGNATVTLCHMATPDITRFTRQADIVVAAAGSPRFLTREMVREGAVVVDVGINRVLEGEKELIVGDVDFEAIRGVAAAASPVPGGVGPMTIAMLVENTVDAAARTVNG